MGESHLFTNRLIREKSPYLLQHAHNPVDWYPWSPEAIDLAKELDKPIFLSIGYATCHWCHTMEHESFENPEIAQLMNEAFINIKVDREELPEVDALYMDFAQSLMAGSSGWPLNIILTPKLEPFFAATYLPPTSRDSMLGLEELVRKIQHVWKGGERDKIEHQARRIVEFFAENQTKGGIDLPQKNQMQQSLEILFKIADPIYGGLKGAPKFPVGYQYQFLLNAANKLSDSRALFLVERTLDMMHRGGIYDHIGGGFSRYSVDERWLIPHFEKMLYDNALLADAYISAWRFTKKDDYKKIACDILNYVQTSMTHKEGGFYSAEDADSEGHEGLFYIWKYQELEDVLGRSRLKVFAEFFGVTEEGNFENANVLHRPLSLHDFSIKTNQDEKLLEKQINEDRAKLFKVRNERIHPLKDDKILTSWNGLMIHALASAGSAFNESSYTDAAKLGVEFIKTHLWKEEQLYRRWRDGQERHFATLDDYAFLISALLTLFEGGEGTDYLTWAIQLTDQVEELFKSENGAFFQSNGQDPLIILRKINLSDGAEPSGNAVHAENLIRLNRITLNPHYLAQAEDVLRAVKPFMDQYSPGYFYHVMNVTRYHDREAATYIIALNGSEEHVDEIKRLLGRSFNPHVTVIFSYPHDKNLYLHIPSLISYPPKDGKTTLYQCFQGSCLPPITDIHEIKEILAQ